MATLGSVRLAVRERWTTWIVMARNERLAIVDDPRVANLDEPARSFPRAASPVNDVGSSPRGRAVLDDVEDRLHEAFERKLLGPLSEIVERAPLREYQGNDAQAEQLRAVTAIADRESAMLREMLAFVQSAM